MGLTSDVGLPFFHCSFLAYRSFASLCRGVWGILTIEHRVACRPNALSTATYRCTCVRRISSTQLYYLWLYRPLSTLTVHVFNGHLFDFFDDYCLRQTFLPLKAEQDMTTFGHLRPGDLPKWRLGLVQKKNNMAEFPL